ncbi:MAG: RHS repeat-associated core domain-containing protein, partial [Planctomycetota bacterium]
GEHGAGGNLLSFRDPEGVGADYVPDALGRDVTITDTGGAVTTNVYDLGGDLVSHTDEEGETATAAYDARGRRTSATDRLGHVTTFAYDPASDLLSLTDAEGGVTSFAYDTAGRALSLTDPVGNVTSSTYDALGRVLTETNEENATRSLTYDLLGAVASSTDRDGRLTTYDYDDARRLIAENWIDTDGVTVLDTIARTYDDASRLASIADGDSSLTYSRDDDGRITGVSATAIGSPTVALTQALDAVGRPITRGATVNGIDDFLTSWLYDDAGRVTQVSQTSQTGGNAVANKKIDLGYDLKGRLASLTRFESLDGSAPVADSAAVFDDADRLLSLDHTLPGGGAALASYDWSYDADGRLTQTVSADGTADFGYDDTDQLLTTDNTVLADETFSYDLAGNRTMTGYSTGDANRLTADGLFTYEHDLEGHRTKRTTTASGDYQELAWDHGGRLTEIAFRAVGGALQKSVAYDYDAWGRRIGKAVDTDGDGTVDRGERYVWDGTGGFGHVNDVVLTYDLSGNLVRRTLVGPGADQLFAVEDGSGDVDWALGDHQGSVRDWAERASGTASVVDHLAYDSYGGVLSQSDPTRGPPAYAYTGREWDADAELYYYRARWYDPVAGRFISEDPLGFGGGDANVQRYGGNGPLNGIDPTGLSFLGDLKKKANRFYDKLKRHKDQLIDGVIEGAVPQLGLIEKYGPGPLSQYAKDYREVLRGVGDCGFDMVTGLPMAIMNYEETLEGLAAAASDLSGTAKAMWDDFWEKTETLRGQGQLLCEATTAVMGAATGGGAGLKALQLGKKASDLARRMAKRLPGGKKVCPRRARRGAVDFGFSSRRAPNGGMRAVRPPRRVPRNGRYVQGELPQLPETYAREFDGIRPRTFRKGDRIYRSPSFSDGRA